MEKHFKLFLLMYFSSIILLYTLSYMLVGIRQNLTAKHLMVPYKVHNRIQNFKKKIN